MKEAFTWYRKAAEQGDVSAQHNIGVMYAQGVGVIKDVKQAVSWYRKAAEKGHASAQFNLGVMYFLGEGVQQDNSNAYVWLSVGVANGSPDPQELRDSVAKKLTQPQLASAQKLAGQYFEKYQSRS
ncbi:Localization factor PodJL [compost metagenome]